MISVIIPTYKPHEYIEACLQSLEDQVLSKLLYEVIIVLNGEKEPYYSNIQKLLNKYSFSSRLFYTDVAGVSNARNIGLDNAQGDYICFVDDDDSVSYNYLKELYVIGTKNSDAIIVSNVRTFYEKDSSYYKDYISYAYDKFFNKKTRSIFSKRSFLSSSCCKLIPVTVIASRRFNTKYHLSEDALFMFEISDNIKDIILSSDDAIYYRRLRPNSASRKKYPFNIRILYKLKLILQFIKIYMHQIRQYNFPFFLSRIIAVCKFHK